MSVPGVYIYTPGTLIFSFSRYPCMRLLLRRERDGCMCVLMFAVTHDSHLQDCLYISWHPTTTVFPQKLMCVLLHLTGVPTSLLRGYYIRTVLREREFRLTQMALKEFAEYSKLDRRTSKKLLKGILRHLDELLFTFI